MIFDKKTIITIVASILWTLIIWGLVSLAFHGRPHETKGFDRWFWMSDYGNQPTLMSGIENIVATKDYAAFQTVFSGTRMVKTIDTQEKFSTRVKLQIAMKNVQDLQSQLFSWASKTFVPMMWGQPKGRDWNDRWCGMMRWEKKFRR